MGCTTSRDNRDTSGNISDNSSSGSNLNSSTSKRNTQPLTQEQISSRIESSETERHTTLSSGLKISYAWVCQRGYYPDAPDKENQDCYSILPEYGKDKNLSYFAVYDGHGKEGGACSRFVRDSLPKLLESRITHHMKGKKSDLQGWKQAIVIAHHECNTLLHSSDKIDDILSGTTAISLLIDDDVITVNNVGDSRAIIVSEGADNRLVAKPLSADQTPYRKDERERIIKCGGRILSMSMIEGFVPMHNNWDTINLGEDIDEGGDPPRVWSCKGDYPGTAFSRSIGDHCAKELGVSAEPEILEKKLQPNDRYIVIASDGVFEFLTNQMVADLISREKNILDACKLIVSISYDMWLQYEVRTDDITIIIIRIDELQSTTLESASCTLPVNAEVLSADNLDARPVRRVPTSVRKNVIIQRISTVESDAEDDDADDGNTTTTTADNTNNSSEIVRRNVEECEAIAQALKGNFLFQHLSDVQMESVVQRITEVNLKEGDWIIKQGDMGERFYVVDTGRFEVRVASQGLSKDPTGGNVVHVYDSTTTRHPSFGELSLMYQKPRAASLISLTDSRLWALDRKTFRRVVMRSTNSRHIVLRTLRKVELLKCLNLQQVQRLADLLSEETYAPNESIIRQGDKGDKFYMIRSGKCDVVKDGVGVVFHLKDGDYFGERALLTSEPRVANIIATTTVKVLCIGKESFEEVLGPLSAIIDENRIRREQVAAASLQIDLSKVEYKGWVSSDSVSSILIGTFGVEHQKVSFRTFILSDVDRNKTYPSVVATIEAVKLLTTASKNVFVPSLVFRQKLSNCIHLAFDTYIVGDISTILKNTSVMSSMDTILYVTACIIDALHYIHQAGIVYRSVQPDTLYLSEHGKVLLLDFHISKPGAVGSKTYTICGASDYLAPEQISQIGHNESVDYWSLGLLLYELLNGTNPFSAFSEVATYAKISSYGSDKFPKLTYNSVISSSTDVKVIDAVSLINQLVVALPSTRLKYEGIKSHHLFVDYPIDRIATIDSPLMEIASHERDAILSEGIGGHIDVTKAFDEPFAGDTAWLSDLE